MDFIFMLTHKDRTVPNCLEVLAEIADLGLKHVGFKDVGVDIGDAQAACRRDHGNPGRPPMSKWSAPHRKRSGVRSQRPPNWASTGCSAGRTSPLHKHNLTARGIGYYPFPGRPEGHPTRLGGTPDRDRERLRQCGPLRLSRRRSPCLSRHRRGSVAAHPGRATGSRRKGLSHRRRKHRFDRAYSCRCRCRSGCLHHRLGDLRGELRAGGQGHQGPVRGGSQVARPVTWTCSANCSPAACAIRRPVRVLSVPVKRVVIESSLAGSEAELGCRSRSAAALCGHHRSEYIRGAGTARRGSARHARKGHSDPTGRPATSR